MREQIPVLISLLACLAGCTASSIENRYLGMSGKYGSGQTTMGVYANDGKFSLSDGKSTCAGSFASWQAFTIVFPVTCTDGRSGSVTMTRPSAGVAILAGEGTIQFANGETRRFAFGPKSNM